MILGDGDSGVVGRPFGVSAGKTGRFLSFNSGRPMAA
jgi:hypothetical protein